MAVVYDKPEAMCTQTEKSTQNGKSDVEKTYFHSMNLLFSTNIQRTSQENEEFA